MTTVSTERKYTLAAKPSTQNRGGATGKVGVRHNHHWVGPNWTKPRFEISKWDLAQFGPTQWWVWRTPYLSSGPPQFWVLCCGQLWVWHTVCSQTCDGLKKLNANSLPEAPPRSLMVRPLPPVDCHILSSTKVYTFFWGRLYVIIWQHPIYLHSS